MFKLIVSFCHCTLFIILFLSSFCLAFISSPSKMYNILSHHPLFVFMPMEHSHQSHGYALCHLCSIWRLPAAPIFSEPTKCTHLWTYTHSDTHTHTRTHTHTHTYTHTLPPLSNTLTHTHTGTQTLTKHTYIHMNACMPEK